MFTNQTGFGFLLGLVKKPLTKKIRLPLISASIFAFLFAFTDPTEAQQPEKFHRIGLLIAASNVIAPFADAFRQGLRELGYVEGKNYVLEIRGAGRKEIEQQ